MKQVGTGAASSEQIGKTTINATGDRATIVQGDKVKRQRVRRQRVGTQIVKNMEVRQAPMPSTAKLEPCPICETLNAPLAPKCTRCHHPIAAEREKAITFVARSRSIYRAALVMTATGVVFLVWALLQMEVESFKLGAMRELMALARVAVVLASLFMCTAPWLHYWWHFRQAR